MKLTINQNVVPKNKVVTFGELPIGTAFSAGASWRTEPSVAYASGIKLNTTQWLRFGGATVEVCALSNDYQVFVMELDSVSLNPVFEK